MVLLAVLARKLHYKVTTCQTRNFCFLVRLWIQKGCWIQSVKFRM